MKKNIITYIVVSVLSAIILFLWNGYASDGAQLFQNSIDTQSAKIISVDDENTTEAMGIESTVVISTAQILSGSMKGEKVKVYQEYNSQYPAMNVVKEGDKVVIKNYPIQEFQTEWTVDNYHRTPALWWLVGIFVVLILIFGKTQGLRTIISLIYTVISVFLVFIPSVLSGKNIYVCSVLVCIFIISMSLLLVNGWNKKTFCASVGCIGGVVAAAVITIVFSKIMKLSGYVDEHSYYLTLLSNPVNLPAMSFAAVIIGAVGAVMDVAMSMSSSLYELSSKVEDISFKSLVSSGFSIGRDMMGTMANTLVLAYVGSSVCSVLLLLTYADSAMDIFNREMIASEILQAIAGSIGIILAIPATAVVCGLVYIKLKNKSVEGEFLNEHN